MFRRKQEKKKAQSVRTHTVIQHIITHTTYMQLQRWMKLTEHAEEADDTEETAGESEKERFQSVKLWDSSRSSYATVRLTGSSAHIPFQHALLNMRYKEHKQIQIHPPSFGPPTIGIVKRQIYKKYNERRAFIAVKCF